MVSVCLSLLFFYKTTIFFLKQREAEVHLLRFSISEGVNNKHIIGGYTTLC